jgi:hypothetical protein
VPGTITGSSREDITPSSIFVEGSSAVARGKEKTSEIPAVPVVRSIKEQAINSNL